MSIRPIHDKVIVQIEDPERTTAGGLIIPDTAHVEHYVARVIAAGPGGACTECGALHTVPVGVKDGERVLIAKYAKEKLPSLGERVYSVRPEHILGVIE